VKSLILGAALVIFAGLVVSLRLGESPQTGYMAAIAILMALLWITEAIPLAATALLPLVLFPLFGIAATKAVAAKYMNSTVFLLLGGFLIAQAMERWQLHRRIALAVLTWFGGKPVSLMIGFMAATAFLSMWISNTATTLVMLPIALAILTRFEELLGPQASHRFAVVLLLAIAYSASIGGMMTLVGTAPNLVFARLYEETVGEEVDFLRWMLIGLPVGMTMLVVLVFYLWGVYLRKFPKIDRLETIVAQERALQGKISNEEKSVALVFAVTALLWISRKGVTMNGFHLPGWQQWLAFGKLVDDGTVAIAMATVLFFVPARNETGQRTTLLDQAVFMRLPWPVVILFGGGFALASGFEHSGLSAWIASQLQGLAGASRLGLMASVSGGMTFLTELTSNTATTQLVLPILASLARALQVDPVWLMLPATVSASCAFMFPVATPPNAIIFGSGRVRVWEMVKTGLVLNVVGIVVVTGLLKWLIPKVFL